MEWLIIILIVVVVYYKVLKPKRIERQEAYWNQQVNEASNSDFVNEGMQTLAVMLALRESDKLTDKRADRGLFCVTQGTQFLFQLYVRADSLIFLIKHQGDGVRDRWGNIICPYEKILADNLDSVVNEAKKKEPRLETVGKFENLDINYMVDPEDEYDEWMIFEKQIYIPSRAYVEALKLEIEKNYPGYIGRKTISFIS